MSLHWRTLAFLKFLEISYIYEWWKKQIIKANGMDRSETHLICRGVIWAQFSGGDRHCWVFLFPSVTCPRTPDANKAMNKRWINKQFHWEEIVPKTIQNIFERTSLTYNHLLDYYTLVVRKDCIVLWVFYQTKKKEDCVCLYDLQRLESNSLPALFLESSNIRSYKIDFIPALNFSPLSSEKEESLLTFRCCAMLRIYH